MCIAAVYIDSQPLKSEAAYLLYRIKQQQNIYNYSSSEALFTQEFDKRNKYNTAH